MRRVARYGDGWLPYMYTAEHLRDSVVRIAELRAEYGRTEPVRTGLFIFFCVHPNRETAVQMAVRRLSKQYAQDFSKLIGKYALAGTPDEYRKRLQEYIDAGAKMVMLPSACPSDYIDENTRLIGEEIIPAFR